MTVSQWQFGDLRTFGYQVIVADPPWDFKNYSDAGTLKGADPHYDVMTLDAIKALRVGELASGDCLLLMWTTGWAMATCQAQEVARAWGFKPITEMIWRKLTTNGKPRMGTGYRVRTLHEPILVCTLGNPRHQPLPSSFDGIAREHSRKPVEFYELVAKHTPGADRCDLFSRKSRDGFAGWGYEHGKFDSKKTATDEGASDVQTAGNNLRRGESDRRQQVNGRPPGGKAGAKREDHDPERTEPREAH